MKQRRIWVSLMGLVLLLSQLWSPSVAMAADSAHYELQSWKFGIVGDSASMVFNYIGTDGVLLKASSSLSRTLVNGHENDPSWTGFDSVAPLLAYIKQNGIDNNIREDMNPTVFDPTIFKALTGQGINLSQLGGPNVPPGSTPPSNLLGKSVFPSTLDKLIVGIGIPAPNLSAISSTQQSPPLAPSTTVSQGSAQKTAAATSPAPPSAPTSPVTSKSSSSSSEAKIGTALNPTPAVKESVAASKSNPGRVDPSPMAINDTTPTKIKAPANVGPSGKVQTDWKDYLELGGLFLALVAGAIYIKKNYAHS